jgi:glycerol-3-phosphate dehydrogenase
MIEYLNLKLEYNNNYKTHNYTTNLAQLIKHHNNKLSLLKISQTIKKEIKESKNSVDFLKKYKILLKF